jgi:hypothetical protein
MFRKILFIAAIGAALSPVLLGGSAVEAHNAAHIELPTGTCLNIASGKSVILPEAANAYTTALGERDLNPSTLTRDEIGARFAADRANSAVLPGHVAGCQ